MGMIYQGSELLGVFLSLQKQDERDTTPHNRTTPKYGKAATCHCQDR